MPYRILIADDAPANLRLLQAILVREGYELILAADGEEAIRQAKRLQPDLVLLDVMMPYKDGYAVCQELRAHPTLGRVPIIFLSVLGSTEDKVRGLDLGAVDYITKPFDRVEVLARVRTQLRLYEVRQSLLESNRKLAEQQQRHEEDLRAAGEVQRALLPQERIFLPGIEVAWCYRPIAGVGGDLLNVVRLDESWVALYLFDVSGHGISAALVSVALSQSLSPVRGIVTERAGPGRSLLVTPPARVLARLAQEYPLERFGSYITMVYLLLNAQTGELRYSAAGHPPPLLMRRTGEVSRLVSGGPMIGFGDEDEAFVEDRLTLLPGERLVLYSDGVIEHGRGSRGVFGVDSLIELLGEFRDREAEALADALLPRLLDYGDGEDLEDDVSLLVLDYVGPRTDP